jgi:hypothetical protein
LNILDNIEIYSGFGNGFGSEFKYKFGDGDEFGNRFGFGNGLRNINFCKKYRYASRYGFGDGNGNILDKIYKYNDQ